MNKVNYFLTYNGNLSLVIFKKIECDLFLIYEASIFVYKSKDSHCILSSTK